MQINGVKKTVEELWANTESTWKDDVSKKYKNAVVNEMGEILQAMQTSCDKLMISMNKALDELKELQD